MKKKANSTKLLLSIVVGVMIALMGANYKLQERHADAVQQSLEDKIGIVREDIRDLKQVMDARRLESKDQRELIAEVRRWLAAIDVRLENLER